MIRIAEAHEAEWAEALVRAAYQRYVARMGREPAPMLADYPALIAAGEVHVLVKDDERVGLIVLRSETEALFVENVAVAPQHQGEGHGRALMAFAEREAHRRGHALIWLYTNEAMTENPPFYEALGFREARRAVEEGYRRIFMEKRLS